MFVSHYVIRVFDCFLLASPELLYLIKTTSRFKKNRGEGCSNLEVSRFCSTFVVGNMLKTLLGDQLEGTSQSVRTLLDLTVSLVQEHTHTCLVESPVFQAGERRKGAPAESNGFGNHGNLGNLPDLLQQSNSPSATPTTALQELGDISEVRPAILITALK